MTWGVSRGTWLVLFVLVSILADVAPMQHPTGGAHECWNAVAVACLVAAAFAKEDR